MPRFIPKLKDYFSFRRGERVGLSVLIVLIVVILSIPYIYQFFRRQSRTDFTSFDSEVKEFQNKQSAFSNQQSAQNNRLSAFSYKQTAQNYHSKKENFIVELNGADSLELMRLRGIGPVFAKKIIRYRELLGGYWRKEQLMEVWGMDSVRYNGIKEHIAVNRDSIHKININKIAFKKLMKHPYIGYELARGLVAYRIKHGEFKTVEEVRNVKGINDIIYKRLELYIKVR